MPWLYVNLCCEVVPVVRFSLTTSMLWAQVNELKKVKPPVNRFSPLTVSEL